MKCSSIGSANRAPWLGTYCRTYQHVSDELDDLGGSGTVGILVRIVDRKAAAHTRTRSGEQRHDEIGELIPRQAAGFVVDVGQPLCPELGRIEHVEVDVQPPPTDLSGQLLDRA